MPSTACVQEISVNDWLLPGPAAPGPALEFIVRGKNVGSITIDDDDDCYIDICCPEVLSLFTDNFDYQHLRRHFVKGLLVDDIMGYKIFTHEIHSSYAARIDNFRSYDTVKIGLSRSAQIGPFTVIGNGTKIGNHTTITSSVIGEGCNIGSNVSIEGSYIWDNVTIGDGCKLRHAIVCAGVIMKSGAVLEPGVILSFKVLVGQQFVVPSYSMVSLLQQPTKQDSDEELEYADNSSGIVEIPCTSDKSNGEMTSEQSESQCWPASQLGSGGAGYIWSICEGAYDEEWRHSVAPIPADKLAEAMDAADDDQELTQDGSILPPSGELKPDSNDSEDDDNEDSRDEMIYFEKEVEATFLRAVHENIKVDHVILEVNSLRLSYNKVAADCAGAIFYAMMKLALETPHTSAGELLQNATNVITKWKKLLKYYLADIDEEMEVILRFEEMCLESAKEFSPLFTKILIQLYDQEVIQEDAILRWDDEKKGADESDKIYVKQAEKFIQWLKEASEEEDEEEEGADS
ncbi:hypothetical protein FEM48_Zijuj05G0162700 [Ziziphus jujuba var. spinosa]|uniref:Translation initiation factor eIF2B subunit epsilon n=1 Tax=Ziziphus jujuba var. spinosa TaxID=714518 RepID=A0A978VFU2_ZIZJJ|nr:hypothetical protein FEM48_Zijuj05G0162700 [Ziziphus jujuba var. spinosa]